MIQDVPQDDTFLIIAPFCSLKDFSIVNTEFCLMDVSGRYLHCPGPSISVSGHVVLLMRVPEIYERRAERALC